MSGPAGDEPSIPPRKSEVPRASPRIGKLLLQGLGVIVALMALAWSGLLIYWHFKVSRSIRILKEEKAPPRIEEAVTSLRKAGCRALPHLVGSLDPGEDPFFLMNLSTVIAVLAEAPSGGDTLYSPTLGRRMEEWRIEVNDSDETRKDKCARMREWWDANGTRYHQSWRVWSKQCGTN